MGLISIADKFKRVELQVSALWLSHHLNYLGFYSLRIVTCYIIAMPHVNLDNFSKIGHKRVGRCESVGRATVHFSF